MYKILSVDLGTMGIKITVIDENCDILASASEEYPIISEKTGYSEQNPQEWWNGFLSCTKRIGEKNPGVLSKIDAVSICGQMHTQVYLDKDGEPLCNAITWMDQRSSDIVDEMKENGSDRELLEETFNFITTTYTAPQIMWMKKEQPEIYKKTESILLAKDYIKYLLTGEKSTDPSDASGTLLYDVKNNRWSDRAFQLTGISRDMFPQVKKSKEIIGFLREEVSRITGITQGVPVINGGSDHSVAEIGSGLLEEGRGSIIIGTAGVIATCSKKPVYDKLKRTICWAYPIDGMWDVLGITQTAASSLTWFRNNFDSDSESDIFEEYSRLAATVKISEDNPIFLPYLMGERTPHWDSHARGVFFGLSISHTKAHMIRAIMEGVVFSIRECFEVFEDLGIEIDKFTTMGGGSRSEIWRNIESSVLNREINTLKCEEASAVGNLILSMLGTGRIKNPEDAKNMVSLKDRNVPDGNVAGVYDKLYGKYRDLYKSLKPLFH